MLKAICILFACTILTGSSAFVLQPTIEQQTVIDDVAFSKLGTYRGFTADGVEYQKSYFLSRYSKAPWAETKAICRAFDLELPRFETLTEARAVLTMADNNSILKTLTSVWIWIDGITLTSKSTTDWYWTKTGMKVSFPMDWYPGNPSGGQNCLAISKAAINARFGFNDVECYTPQNIICQRVELYVPNKEEI
ncbi:uncharacterized protein [Chironomus tepperi]|uniref:uncharacterized protein n=1 Tax=Chironomus tepperi TaxID=113505 RepID=UPI00391F739A